MPDFYNVPKRLSDDIDIVFPEKTVANIYNDLFVQGLSLKAFVDKYTANAKESNVEYILDWRKANRYRLSTTFSNSSIWMIVVTNHHLHDYQFIIENENTDQYIALVTYCNDHPKFRKITNEPNHKVYQYMIESDIWFDVRKIFIVLEKVSYFKMTITLNL